MSKSNSSKSATPGKPERREGLTPADTRSAAKPERPADSPLFWHATGRWAKKIRGKLVYFGRGSHHDALTEYDRQKHDLHAGRAPVGESEELTIRLLAAKFLTTKKHLRDTGELSPRSFADYLAACQLLQKVLGANRLVADLRPDDFERLRKRIANNCGLVRVGNTINRVRIVFNYGWKNGLLDRPMLYGEGFRRPSKKSLRKHRLAQGERMFEAAEIRAMLDKATQPLKAMLLLGVNCGYGNSDIGTLPLGAVDLDSGWLTYGRPKTGIARRCALWPETVRALREWLAVRPKPANEAHAGLVFLTIRGGSWAKETSDNPISKETAKLMKECQLNGHRNFYCLHHCFQTVGDESGDFLAVRKIMGHVSNDIADVYRERISDARLRAVANHVRKWLFGDAPHAAY
jgi:integrase